MRDEKEGSKGGGRETEEMRRRKEKVKGMKGQIWEEKRGGK